MNLMFLWERYTNRLGDFDFRKKCLVLGLEEDFQNPYWKYLCSAFSFDFTSAEYCSDILLDIKKIELGEMEKTGWSGNAFDTLIYRDRVEIEHQQFSGHPDWPMWTCTLEEFKIALLGWKRFLEMPISVDSEVIVELPSPRSS